MGVKNFNDKLKKLRSIIMKEDQLTRSKELLLELHSMVHSSSVYNLSDKTIEDFVWDNINEETIRVNTNKKGRTALYSLWHSTRIEDMTMNCLVKNRKQVFNREWKDSINSIITDTGNSLTEKEILEFSSKINISQLRKYRDKVACVTKEILQSLEFKDFKRRFNQEQLDNLFKTGSVAREDNSSWLVDYWGKKNVAGLLFMPATRHNLVHLNEAIKLLK